MSLTLINRSGRCLALNLPHAEVCTAERCSCVTLPGRPPRRVAGSLTGVPLVWLASSLAPCERSRQLPGASARRA